MGIIWRGIMHDMSKFLPSEFFAYRDYFYSGYEFVPRFIEDKFDFAWHWHLKRNKHHWQWWIIKYDNGGLKIFEMPEQYRKEMLADWIGVGKAIHGKADIEKWYNDNKSNMALAPETRRWVEEEIREIVKENDEESV
jgi:hypothetical protein